MIIPRDDATVRDGLPDDFAPLTPSTPADPAGGTPGLPEDFATVDPADDAPEWSILKSGAFVRRNQMEEEAEAGPSLQGIMDAYAAVYGPGGEKLREVNDLLDAGLPESAKLDQDTVRKFIVQKNLRRMDGDDSPKVEMGGLFVNPASEDFRRFADLEKEIRELHAQAPAEGTWDRMKRAYADGSFQTRMGFLRAKIEQGAASDDERFAYAALSKLPTLHDESDPFSWRRIIPWAWDKATAGAASIAPMLIDTVAAGAQGALTGATAGAAAGSLAGGVGAGAGAALGALAGASAYAFKAAYDLESGYALRELDAMEDRTGKVLDPYVKTGAAAFIGILNGTLELAGIGILARLTPGVRTIVSASMRKGITAAATRMLESGLMASVIDAGKEVLKGTAKETGVELAQEVVSITGEEIAKSLSNSFQGTVFAGQDTTDMGLRLAETGVNAFFSFLPITGIPAGASLTLNVGDKALASVAKRIGQTDMAKKHPAIMENMLAGLVERGQLPERAYLPAASIQALFQGADGVVDSGAEDALLARLGVERDDYAMAIDSGAEIAISAPKALARLAADARTAGLTGLLTYAPIEFEAEQSAKNAKPAQAPPGEGQEAQAGPVELSDEDRQSLTALFQDAVPDDRVSPFAERIAQDFVRAGYSQAQADVFARIIDANANVWARETGQDAAAYYGRYGYRVERTKFGNILNAVREKYYPNLAWPDFERRYQKDDAFHGEVNARSGETLTTLKTDQEIEAWAKEQKQAFTPETHNPLVAHIWGRVNPKLLTPAQRKELTSIYGPKLFSRTRRNANGADVNNGQGLDQLEMEEAVVNLLPQTYGSDTLYTYLVEQGQGMGAARAEWDAQVDAAAERMREEITARPDEDVAVAADIGAFQDDVWWQGESSPRGATVFVDAQATIHFFEAADVSTAGHEIYHVFRRVLEDMAMAESATPEVKDDWAMACAFVGAEVGQKWTTEQEEKWARAGETYLLEGRSPSLELAGAFQRMRKWLVKLYRAMRGKVKLTNDMRGVFDRMLAADEEIEYAKAAGMIRPLLDKAKAPAEYAAILRRTELSGEQAILERRLAEERREAKGWRKFAAQVAKDDERHRTVDALVAAGGIDPQSLEGLYDEETIKKVRRLRIGLLKEGGASAVDMAMAYEFDHVDAMIDFLASVPTKKAIRDQVMAQLKAEWDSTFDASAAMATEEAEYLKEYEHRVIAENTRGEVITADKLRAFVNEKVGALSLKRIDQDYANLAAAMRREGKAAAQAYRAGTVAERLKAAQAMAKHRRAFAEYKARQQAKDYIAKTLRLFRREVNSKTLPLEYRARIQEVLKAYGLGDLSKSPLKTEKGLAAWYAELQMANEPIFIEPHLLTGQAIKPWRDMALEELKDLDEAVRQIAHYGRTQNKLLKSARKANLDAAAKEILDHVSTFHKMDKQAVDIVPTLAERMRRPFRELDMWLVRPEFLLERLDGFEAMGTVWQYIFKPIQDANNEKARLWRQVGRGLKDIIDRYSATDRALMRTRRFRAPGINELVTKEVILSLALNWGNEGNRVAIREGYGWTDAQVQAALDASMNKDDWEVVQSIWDLMESFWPRIDAVHKVMTGAQLPKVAASEVVTPHGTFRGGYYPLALDPRLDWKAAQNQDAQAYSEKRETVLRAAKPRAGHRKARTGTKRKPMLHGGLTVILKHFETVLHDVTHSEAVRDVNRLLTHDDVRRAIEGAAGREGYVALTAWLQNVANPEKMVNSPFDKWLLRARRNASIVAMGLKITTAMVQPLGLVNSWSRVPAQWLMKGLAVYASNPWKARQFVFERSAEMEARIKNFDRDAHDSMAGLLPGSLDAKITGFSFWFIGFMDAQVAVPTWMAAYSQAMNEKKLSENEAIDYADQQVRMTQSSGWVKDLSRIMTGNQLRRLFTMFYSFMNTTWNLIQNRFGAARYGRINFVQFAASTVMMLVVPAVWQWLYDNRGNDDDPEAKDLFFEVGRTAGGMFPIVREMASFFVNPEFGFRLSPTQAAFEAPVNLVKELMRPAEDKDIRPDVLARVGADFLGYGFGLPTRQAFITVDGLFDLWNEETDDPLRLLFPKPWRK
jgi:hypothetical protein